MTRFHVAPILVLALAARIDPERSVKAGVEAMTIAALELLGRP